MKVEIVLKNHNHAVTVENLETVKTLNDNGMEAISVTDLVIGNRPFLFIGDITIAIRGNRIAYLNFYE